MADVALFTTTVVASCPPNEAFDVYPAVKNPVPVKVIVEESVLTTAETSGNPAVCYP